MPVPITQDITHYRGDTLAILVRLWEDDAKTVPADLTGATVTSQVKVAVDKEVLAEFEPTIAANVVTLTLLPADSAVMPKAVVYDAQVDWDSDNLRVQTVVKGKITFDPDVTLSV